MPCLSTPKIEYRPLQEAVAEISSSQRIDLRTIANATRVSFPKLIALVNLQGTHEPDLYAHELVSLARFADVPLSELVVWSKE